MQNYLAHLGPEASVGKVRSELAGMDKADVVDTAVELYKKGEMARNVTPGLVAGGTIAGLSLGEGINLALKAYGESKLPGAGLVMEWLSLLKIVPHALLGGIGAVKYSGLESRGQTVAFSASLGLLGPVGARIIDLIMHNGDLTRKQEQEVRAELEVLRAENARLKGGTA